MLTLIVKHTVLRRQQEKRTRFRKPSDDTAQTGTNETVRESAKLQVAARL